MLMLTFTGRTVDLSNFRAEDINLEDIAHALAHLPRFGGHTLVPYSVAQHSLHVARHVRATHPDLELLALLHDASEAYLGDVIRPVKELIGPIYRSFEDKLSEVIWTTLTGKPTNRLPDVIKSADDAVLDTERRHLFGLPDDATPRAVNGVLDVWPARWAKTKWLKRFGELTEKSA